MRTPLRVGVRGRSSLLRYSTAVFAALLLVGCVDSKSPLTDGGAQSDGSKVPVRTNTRFADTAAAAPARHTGPQGSFGQFVTDCAVSHSAPDDPIVYPSVSEANHDGADHDGADHDGANANGTNHDGGGHGSGESGGSHLHVFFGNTSTDSASTLSNLREADTTCQKKPDTAAYWAPALYDHGEVVEPTNSTAYYRVAPKVDPKSIEAFPPGLKIIAGDADAVTEQSSDLAGWSCGTSTIQFATPPSCPSSAPLRAVITFPDCWDGTNTDSSNHRSHMANSSDGLCPRSHPVNVPQLTFAISYPVFGTGHDLSLASGPIESLHSDFINSWQQESLERETRLCLRRGITCSVSSNRGEEFLFAGA